MNALKRIIYLVETYGSDPQTFPPKTAKQAAAELARLQRVEQERDALRAAMKAAQIKLQSTAGNWGEQCLFDCNAIMTAALKGETK